VHEGFRFQFTRHTSHKETDTQPLHLGQWPMADGQGDWQLPNVALVSSEPPLISMFGAIVSKFSHNQSNDADTDAQTPVLRQALSSRVSCMQLRITQAHMLSTRPKFFCSFSIAQWDYKAPKKHYKSRSMHISPASIVPLPSASKHLKRASMSSSAT